MDNQFSKNAKTGQFCTKRRKLYQGRCIAEASEKFENARRERERLSKLREEAGNITSTMRRVVELQELAKQLWCNKCNKPLSLRHFVSEEQYGMASRLKIRCVECDIVFDVSTCKREWDEERHSYSYDVNCKTAFALMDAGIGEHQWNAVLSAMNMPAFSKPLLKRYERKVGPAIEKVAKDSCIESIAQEKALTLAAEEVDDGTLLQPSLTPPPITPPPTPSEDLIPSSTPAAPTKVQLRASYDAGWQKRGTGHSYNSLSGHGSLIGFQSGKVLAYDTRSKICALCSRGHPKSDHDCRKNYEGSAKAMEPSIAVDIICRNADLDSADVAIGTLIGDDDCSTFHAVSRESTISVTKWSDLNHVRKAFSSALYGMKLPEGVRQYLLKCFTYALAGNRNDVEGTRNALLNVVRHVYGEHDACQDWCKYKEDPENYRHNGLPGGKPLTSLELKASLTQLLTRFANQAAKLAPGASSQANESFNNLVASKHPKSKQYGRSESFAYRVAGAVCQKNKGTAYAVDVNTKLGLSPGDITKKSRFLMDKYRSQRAELQKTRKFKARRALLKQARSRKSTTEERREGITYQTECDLDGIAELVDDPSVPARADISSETQIVLFDLETTGLSKISNEICQIAAKCGEKEFSVYILPKKGISTQASVVTGLTTSGGELFLNGEKVATTPPNAALHQFVTFLQSIGSTIVLAAHNGNRFDAPIILREMKRAGMLAKFMETVAGFIDTLEVFKEKLPHRKSYKQTSLAADYGITNDNAHNALGDVRVLDKLLSVLSIRRENLVVFVRAVRFIIENERKLAQKPILKSALQVLKPEVTTCMISKIVNAGLSLEALQAAFNNSGEKGVAYLLGTDVNGKPRVTKLKSKVANIVSAIKKSLQKE